MNRESRACQNCKKEFTIEPEDFKFYEKIKVPPPTWCPECRIIRKMVHRNERTFYQRKCDLCGQNVIAIYSPEVNFLVYCHQCWWSDKWEPMKYGQEYNFSENFFSQFRRLLSAVPLQGLVYENAINSPYINHAANAKNSYLAFGSHDIENVSYAKDAIYVKDSLDIAFTSRSELCYETIDCTRGFNIALSIKTEDSHDSLFLFDCRNCNNCIGCTALRNKSYCIFNEQFTREEYYKKLKELDLGSFKSLEKFKSKFRPNSLKYPRRYATIRNSINVVGDDIYNSKNCYKCFYLTNGAENCKYSTILSEQIKDSYDIISAAFRGSELLYDAMSVIGHSVFFGYKVWHSFNVILSYDCHNSQNLFACIGLRNKSYCILNKQYTKEEYEKMVPRIIEHMNDMPYIDKKGRVYKYGEFFPPELSPFSYNETIAQEYFPLTKEEAIEKGYSWKAPEPRNYQIQIPNDKLPDHIKDVKDEIVNKVIECGHIKAPPAGGCNEQCTEAYKIIEPELKFLRRMNLPLPRLCPNCRHYQRIKQRNPLKLWHRRCECEGPKSKLKGQNQYINTAEHIQHKKDTPCPNEFETTYAPERPEIVYCEQCYIREVV